MVNTTARLCPMPARSRRIDHTLTRRNSASAARLELAKVGRPVRAIRARLPVVGTVGPRRGTIILLCGLPGSGKTTTARSLARQRRAVRLCPDEWIAYLAGDFFDDAVRERVEELQWRLARDVALTGGAAIIESGHWLKSDRDTKRDWARGHGVGIELIVLDVPIEERWQRLAARNAAPGPASVPLTLEALRSYEGLFQMPDAEEQSLYDPSLGDAGPT